MEYTAIKESFLERHGLEPTDWVGIKDNLLRETPATRMQIAGALALDWTEHKDDPSFAKPGESLVDCVSGVIGITDPFDVTETELTRVTA
jgi:hypothetical protein